MEWSPEVRHRVKTGGYIGWILWQETIFRQTLTGIVKLSVLSDYCIIDLSLFEKPDRVEYEFL
jgi:hypothetical protein